MDSTLRGQAEVNVIMFTITSIFFMFLSELDATHRDPKAASVSAAGDMYFGT